MTPADCDLLDALLLARLEAEQASGWESVSPAPVVFSAVVVLSTAPRSPADVRRRRHLDVRLAKLRAATRDRGPVARSLESYWPVSARTSVRLPVDVSEV